MALAAVDSQDNADTSAPGTGTSDSPALEVASRTAGRLHNLSVDSRQLELPVVVPHHPPPREEEGTSAVDNNLPGHVRPVVDILDRSDEQEDQHLEGERKQQQGAADHHRFHPHPLFVPLPEPFPHPHASETNHHYSSRNNANSLVFPKQHCSPQLKHDITFPT